MKLKVGIPSGQNNQMNKRSLIPPSNHYMHT